MELNKKNIEDIYALSALQEGILFHHLKDKDARVYFSQLILDLSGDINVPIFRNAWQFVVNSNEILRTVFRWDKINTPVQILLKEVILNLKYIDLSSSSSIESTIEKILIDDKEKGFDLTKIPFHIILLKCSTLVYKCIISNHLILYDGWSNGILLNEFLTAYNELVKGRTVLPVNKIKFKEYIKYDLAIRKINKYHEFWSNYLKDVEQTGFLLKNTDEEFNDYRSYSVYLSSQKSKELRRISQNYKTTIANLFYCIWGILLMKYTNANDVVFGTTISVRDVKLGKIDEIVGLLINTIPLRFKFQDSETIHEFIKRADNEIKKRQPYQHLPLQFILDNIHDKNKRHILDSIFIVENYPVSKKLRKSNENITINAFSIEEASNYKLAVSVLLNDLFKENDKIQIKFYYNAAQIDPYYINNISNHFLAILDCFIKDEYSVLSDINLFSENDYLVNKLNDTKVDYPKDDTSLNLFKQQVK